MSLRLCLFVCVIVCLSVLLCVRLSVCLPITLCLSVCSTASEPVAAKFLAYNRANRTVAVLCNHQRAVPKNFSKQMENLQAKVRILSGQFGLVWRSG